MPSELDPAAAKAREEALRFLTARARSIHEVAEKLKRRGFGAEVVEQVTAELQRLRLLDDRAFARDWIDAKLRSRPSGARRIHQELRQKGISEELVAEALAEFGRIKGSPSRPSAAKKAGPDGPL